jgi:hypothetical protein
MGANAENDLNYDKCGGRQKRPAEDLTRGLRVSVRMRVTVRTTPPFSSLPFLR